MNERPIIFSAEMVRAILAGRKTQTRRLVAPSTCEWGSFGHAMWEAADFAGAWPDRGFPDDRGAYPYGYLKVGPKPDHPEVIRCGMEGTAHRLYPRATPGDEFWVRESCRAVELESGLDGVRFEADGAFIPIADTPAASEAWGALFYYRGRGRDRTGSLVPPIHMPRWACRLRLRVEAGRIERLHDITEDGAAAEGVAAAGWVDEADVGCRSYREGFAPLWDSLHGRGAWDANPWVVVLTFAPLPLATKLGPVEAAHA